MVESKNRTFAKTSLSFNSWDSIRRLDCCCTQKTFKEKKATIWFHNSVGSNRYQGPDHLESTILKNYFLKYRSSRWLEENNRLIFSITGIYDQDHNSQFVKTELWFLLTSTNEIDIGTHPNLQSFLNCFRSNTLICFLWTCSGLTT